MNIQKSKMEPHEKNYCPKTETCPLFQGKIVKNSKAHEVFLKFYCTAGETGRLECKRFLLSLENYEPDTSVLPNDPRSIAELKKDSEKQND